MTNGLIVLGAEPERLVVRLTTGADFRCDMVLRGGALPDPWWRVGIQHPSLPDRIARVLLVAGLAVATSGTYERGEHILDPHTGGPPAGVLSVTIVGTDLATADAYATAAFAMGSGAVAWTSVLPGFEALTILADETMVVTPGFPPAPAAGPPVRRPVR